MTPAGGPLDHNASQRAYFEERVPATMVPSSTPYVRRHVEELVRAAGLRPGDAVLEVGAGMGRYTLEKPGALRPFLPFQLLQGRRE